MISCHFVWPSDFKLHGSPSTQFAMFRASITNGFVHGFVRCLCTFWVSPAALTQDGQTVRLDQCGWTGGGGGAGNSATEFGAGADSVDTESACEVDDVGIMGGVSAGACSLSIAIGLLVIPSIGAESSCVTPSL